MGFKYKKFNMPVAVLAAMASCLASVIMDFAYGEIGALSTWNLSLFIIARFVGSVFFAGVTAYYLVKVLEATGVTNLVRPVSNKDYAELD
jgi:energy-coupling factor transport system substrate-specific component